MTIPQVCKRLQISDQTFYRWRLKYGALKEDEAQRLKTLEQENAATAPDEVWSYDFVSARTRSGAPLRILNVVDEYTRIALGCRVAPSIGAREVQAFLAELFQTSKPRRIRSDIQRTGVHRYLSGLLAGVPRRRGDVHREGPTQQNTYVERFNGTMRDEVLNGEEFANVLEARVVLGRFIEEYNQRQPHRGLGMRTPMEFADACRKGSA